MEVSPAKQKMVAASSNNHLAAGWVSPVPRSEFCVVALYLFLILI
jgi:hypothetical protein